MQPSYYDNVNLDLLKMIPLDIDTVLEVGCGAGALGRAYKMRNPLCRYIGVELFADAADIAKQHLDMVICNDVEKIDLYTELSSVSKIDCLVYGDVLEHLRDPWRVLREHVVLLRDAGQVVACIPNVQHWSVMAGLITGQWHYDDSGILDRTHLRFFTLEGILELFSQAGLKIHEIIPRIFEHPEKDRVQSILAGAANMLGVQDLPTNRIKMAALQYVVRAKKM